MMGRPESILGKQADRVKTDMRLPAQLSERVNAMAKSLGVASNVIHTMAVAYFLSAFVDVVPEEKGREAVLNEMEKLFLAIFHFVREKNERKS
jgi:predicted DNA-binding protein